MGNGKGISDAVRGAINDWVVPDILNQISAAAGCKINRWDVNDAKQWVRYVRRLNPNAAGWERDYRCKGNGLLELRVHTNQQDTRIEYVTFRVKGKVVAGGAVDVPSVNISQAGRDTSMDLKVTAVAIKGSGSFVAKTVAFKPFTAKQIAQFEAELEFGAAGLVDRMLIFDERV